MKKILEILLRDDGLAVAGCELETELETARLAASMVCLGTENKRFKDALLSACQVLVLQSQEAESRSKRSQRVAASRMFGGPKKGGN